MKILLIKTDGIIPLEIKSRHLSQIRDIDKNVQVVVVSSKNTKDVQKELIDADVIAGVPFVIPPISSAKKLKWIHSFSAGVEKVLTDEILNSEVIVTNSSGIHAIPIAEHVLGSMLIFSRRFYDTFRKQQEKIWEANQDLTELRGKIVLIAGLGKIGTEVARLSKCLGMTVIAVKKNGKNKPNFVDKLYSKGDLNNALTKADFVISCLPHTNETNHLFDMKKFMHMKKSAIFINIGRGGTVHEKELILALDKKLIFGAALDVTEEEPLPKNSPLWDMENVIITPHHAGWSEKYMDRGIDIFCLNLKAYLESKPLLNLVDKKRGY